jgi:hypothetical protein
MLGDGGGPENCRYGCRAGARSPERAVLDDDEGPVPAQALAAAVAVAAAQLLSLGDGKKTCWRSGPSGGRRIPKLLAANEWCDERMERG